MSGTDTAILRDRAPLSRPGPASLRRRRLMRGPLKPLARHEARPGLALMGGVIGLSLAISLLVVPQLRGGDPAPEPAISAVGEPREPAEAVRVVGLPPLPAPAPADGAAPAEAPPSASPATAPAQPVVEPFKPAAVPTVDLGPLPVLELDATAFDAMQAPAGEEMPRPTPQAARRP